VFRVPESYGLLEKSSLKHSYAVIRCKTCSTLTTLKYLGEQHGKTIHTLLFPPEPILTVFSMPCRSCGSTHDYIRTDVECIVLEQAPPSDFVDQIPLASVISKDFDD
jgi:hypothetical protein